MNSTKRLKILEYEILVLSSAVKAYVLQIEYGDALRARHVIDEERQELHAVRNEEKIRLPHEVVRDSKRVAIYKDRGPSCGT